MMPRFGALDSQGGLEICERLSLKEGFDRWRYVQKLLDLETDITNDNQILYHVLSRYQRSPEIGDDSLASPERTRDRLALVRSVLEKADEENESILALTSDFDAEMLLELDQLLPDPCEEEEAHQSILDGIAELHGRESVKVDEKTGDPEWKARFLVAKVLLFYDFLQKGILIKK
eukprot:CAMPEP_0198141238 /NCGR_PEP_ID=MMETSP1443-20131203/4266_1 /TAXON_ID=186043 /ORGANISM="Entomoneis sp., Strain CCMP2396" /LENGTH=174 /DNA_ID=CAMNT_0043803909 /DNA_START=283 /DNA_END=807 /DNA_ORIENTATION=-